MFGISLCSFLGILCRWGVSYLKPWRTEASFTSMYAELLGCFILGYLTRNRAHRVTPTRMSKVIHTSLTAGLCGSMSSFSSWNLECSKIFILQWDTTWGNAYASYNYARVIEYVVSLWIGVALPLSALRLGREVPVSSRSHDQLISKEPTTETETRFNESKTGPSLVVGAFVVGLVCVVGLPLHLKWPHLAWALVFGALGSCCRHLLSGLNTRSVNLPLGTLISNCLGTWLLAACTSFSKFGVEFENTDKLPLLYGLAFGFSCSLTSTSALVEEIDRLPTRASLKYVMLMTTISQLGCVLIYGLPTYFSVGPSSNVVPGISFCGQFNDLCSKFLDNVNCPQIDRVTNGCGLDLLPPICQCGSFRVSSTRIAELIIDSQVKANISYSLVPTWPTHAFEVYHANPAETVDFCLSYESACDHWLNRINCPIGSRVINACNRDGILNYVGQCTCGAMNVGDTRIAELLIDHLMLRRYDLLPLGDYPTSSQMDMCGNYAFMCRRLMRHVQCPAERIVAIGCSTSDDYSTWQGSCSCGANFKVPTKHMADVLIDFRTKASWNPSYVVNEARVIDGCATFSRLCRLFLDTIGCPQALRGTLLHQCFISESVS